jgi:sugar-specific transcriptional regulator TrmB
MKTIPSLESLGLTRLESLAYAFLVAHPASTGYKVSKGIGKPTANVYRALESLDRKGAVTNDRASPPLFRAVAPDQLLDQLEREFMDRREIAARTLASLEVAPEAGDDDGVFALKTADQVAGRARVLLMAARRVAMIDAPGAVLAPLADTVDDARNRGVRVITLLRGADAGDHADTVPMAASGADGAAPFRVVADGREALIATVATDRATLRDGLWTRSALVARTLHDAIANEVFFVLVEDGLRGGLSVDELEGAFERCRMMRALARD